MKVRVAGLKVYASKGRTYVYHRATGRRVASQPGTPEFFAEVASLDALATPAPATRPGTLGAVITAYRGGTHYLTDLAPRTRADYARVLDWCRAGADMPLSLIDRPFVVRLRDKAREARGRRFGSYVVAVLSAMFGWAVERGLMDDNPAAGVKMVPKDKSAPRANRPWTHEERDAVLAAAPVQLRLPILLGMCLGLREGDAIRAPVSAYDAASGTLTIITAKTRRRVSVVAPADVRAGIAARPRCDATTLCVSSRNAPWTESGFRASFFGLIRRLEAEGTVGAGLTFHGLRHTVGTTLRELGYDTRTIADVLGQSTVQMAEHYSSSADLTEKIGAAVHHLDRARKGRKAAASGNETKTPRV